MIIRNFLILILFAILCTTLLYSQENLDSLATNLDKMTIDEKIKALNILSFSNWNKVPEVGIEYGNRALKLSQANKDLKGEASAYKNIGVNHWAAGNYDESIINHLKALKIHEELGAEPAIASCYTNLALVYNQQGNFAKALDYQLKSLQIDEKAENKQGLLHSCNNIGLIYASLEDYETALIYFLKSYNLQKELNLRENIAYTINNLGVMYDKMEQPAKALEYFNQALKINQENENKWGESNCYYNMARMQASLGNLQLAIKTSEKSLKMRERLNSPYPISQSCVSLGSMLTEVGEYKRAEELLNRALSLSENYGFAQEKSYALQHLFELHERQHKFEKALSYLKEYIQIRDSLYSEEKTNEITILNAQNEIIVKDRENKLLKTSNELNLLEIQNQKKQKLFLAILVTLILILVILVFKHDRDKVKAIKELTKSNELIQKQKNELTLANLKLKDLNDSKNKFFSIIAHDLRNPLVAQLSGFRIFYKHLDSMSKKEIQKIAFEMRKNTTHVLELLENLLHWSRLQMGRIEFEPIPINPQTIAFHCFQVLKLKAEQKKIIMEQVLENIPLILADKNMITLVLNNLLTNAIKFSEPGQKILVSGILEQNYIKISVIDEGIGMKPELLENVFKLDKSSSTLGTQKEKGTGLGLILCKEFLQKNNGSMEITSSLGKGTTVSFKLPAQISE